MKADYDYSSGVDVSGAEAAQHVEWTSTTLAYFPCLHSMPKMSYGSGGVGSGGVAMMIVCSHLSNFNTVCLASFCCHNDSAVGCLP